MSANNNLPCPKHDLLCPDEMCRCAQKAERELAQAPGSVTMLHCRHDAWLFNSLAYTAIAAFNFVWGRHLYASGIITGVAVCSWIVVLWAKLERRRKPNDQAH